jgi:hypothetical protein
MDQVVGQALATFRRIARETPLAGGVGAPRVAAE